MRNTDLLTEEEVKQADQRAKELLYDLGLWKDVSQKAGHHIVHHCRATLAQIIPLEQGLVGQPIISIEGISSQMPRRIHRGKGKPIQTFYPPTALIQIVHSGQLALRLFTGEITERKVTLNFISQARWGTFGGELIREYHKAIMDRSHCSDSTLYTVYSLVDPRTNAVRYIGITKNPRERYRQHCAPSRGGTTNQYLDAWLFALATEGLQPQQKILETSICGVVAARERERYWIARYYTAGTDLCNVGHMRYAMYSRSRANFSNPLI